MPAIKAWVFAKPGLKTLVRSVVGDNVASSVTVPFARWGTPYRWFVIAGLPCEPASPQFPG
jgi:hypothetical protein